MTNSSTLIKDVKIQANEVTLHGNLQIPVNATQMVIFAHGSGSSRFSPRNRYVAEAFNQKGLATLLFDLLTAEEEVIDEQTRELRFNISLLAERLVATTDWLIKQPQYKHFTIGYFGASTGAAAALIAAAKRPEVIRAIVSRGGRPDLAGDSLPHVKSSTLLIVGGWDDVVIELNEAAQSKMNSETELKIIPEATHLFEEPGKLDEVIRYAEAWFLKKLG
ncbi:MAG: dienelactone hydrolase family protein [Gammaproteobacteria bacterium]|nr:dienelactone hydrolase family protein [Gammaproteobacteria bacterium]